MKIITLLFITLSAFTFREPAVSYEIDLKQSSVHWTGYYSFSFGEHTGTINLTKGELSMTGDQLTGGNFQIDMNSLQDTDMPANDG
jgi:hemolysin activation/secretion protein